MRLDDSLPLTVTRAWLAQHGACKEEADLFRTIWPDGTVVTQEVLTDAAKAGLNLEWFAKRVLSPTIYADYLTARTPFLDNYETESKLLRADYHAKCAPVLAEYHAKHALVLADYHAKRTLRLAEYVAKENPLLAEYYAKRDLLFAEYEAKHAPLLAEYVAKDGPLLVDYDTKRNTLVISVLWAAYEKEANHGE